MAADESSISLWSREEDKAFENALVTYPEDTVDRWEKIAAEIPGKSVEEIKYHYELLVEDVNQIESGLVPLPFEEPYSDGSPGDGVDEGIGKKGGHSNSDSSHGGKSSRSDQERRKGMAWTEEEHKLFLAGLEKYGKGDWRSISRNFVVTRTPTQVASHAQKYFIRLNSMNKERRRASIHDIRSVESGDSSVSQGPVTGQANFTAGGGSSGKTTPAPVVAPGVGIYGTTIGQPVGGPIVSAVGTPVNMQPAGHVAYGVRAPMPGPMVGGAPMSVPPVTYTMSHR